MKTKTYSRNRVVSVAAQGLIPAAVSLLGLTRPLEIRAQIAAPTIILMVPRVQTLPGETATVRNAMLRDELHRMAEEDQDVRSRWLKNRADKSLAVECTRVDAANLVRMKQIVAQYGWPGKSLVGSEGANDAFLLVQHADQDPKFQRQCLPLLQKAAQRGEAALPDMALLTDRVLLAQGKKQRYGSQFAAGAHGELVMRPAEDEKHLDDRRRAVGLPSIAEYTKVIQQMYGKQPEKEATESGGKPSQ